ARRARRDLDLVALVVVRDPGRWRWRRAAKPLVGRDEEPVRLDRVELQRAELVAHGQVRVPRLGDLWFQLVRLLVRDGIVDPFAVLVRRRTEVLWLLDDRGGVPELIVEGDGRRR